MEKETIRLRITRNDIFVYFIVVSTILTAGGMTGAIFLFMDKGENVMLAGMLIWLFFMLIIIFLVARIYLRPICIFNFNDHYFTQYFPSLRKSYQHFSHEIIRFAEEKFYYRNIESNYFVIEFGDKKKKIVITKDPLSDEAARNYEKFIENFRQWYNRCSRQNPENAKSV